MSGTEGNVMSGRVWRALQWLGLSLAGLVGMAQIGTGSDICHGYKSHSRVLQLSCQRFAKNLANSLIDTAHTSRAHPTGTRFS